MRKIKLLTIAGSLVMASSLFAPTVSNAYIFASGSNCMAANLNQALQGIGWSQGGVRNNATTSFFVVCPLNWDNTNVYPGATGVIATFPGSTGSVECTVRAQHISGGAYTTTSLTVSAGQGNIGATRGFNLVGTNLTSAPSFTVVCALDPGEGIENAYVG